MKKILIAALLSFTLFSCVPLRPDGQFGSAEFVGKFRNYTVYQVTAPSGATLYFAVDENEDIVLTEHYQSSGKTSYPVPVIYIDGKKVTKEEALQMLKEQK